MDDIHRHTAAALGRIPSGLFILTARRGDAESGMLTSWVQQCSFQPPLISVVIRRDRPITTWLTVGTEFTLNILDHTQTDMVAHFGRGFNLDEPAFEGLEIERPEGGGPILQEAVAFLVCRVADRREVGDHDLFLSEVIGGRVLGESQPMVHVRKSGSHY
jgi:flavin reductase (DIM6/NTAB) family NADH-FMN oxidoreductase RutF